ncbi:MAG: hypothetical protein IH994_06230 [Proteobacteria bacterium]|nr:hypothetical protein [Pseudomonadota bacterium]
MDSRKIRSVVVCLSVLALAGCDSLEKNIVLGAVGATLYGARTPSHEIQQVYYLGSFDPQEQLPPTIYRVRVHGQASILSSTKFASGWVPAEVVDSLNTNIGFDVNDRKKPNVKITKGEEDLSKLETGRRLMQFGPEGFREAPKDHRLVIVMGASPKAFFEGISNALGQVSTLKKERVHSALRTQLFDDLITLRNRQQKLDALEKEISALTAAKGATP